MNRELTQAAKGIVKVLLGDNGNTIAYHPALARVGGGITSGIFLSQLLYWTGKGADPDGWVWKTQVEWTEETALTRSEQETARRRLRERGILEEKQAGIPKRNHYRIDLDVLAALLVEAADTEKSSTQESGESADSREETQGTNSEITRAITTDLLPETEKTGEEVLEEYFGPRKIPIPEQDLDRKPRSEEELRQELLEAERRMVGRLADMPWLDWSDGEFKSWEGTPVAIQERVAWLIEKHTKLVPEIGGQRFWGECCAKVYLAGGGDWDVIEQGIKTAWRREELKYRPSHAKGFVDEVRKTRAAGLQEDVLEVPAF